MEDNFGHQLSETDDTASTCRPTAGSPRNRGERSPSDPADMPSAAVTHSGYSALPARVGGRAFHATLFARAHVSRDSDAELPAGRTLFVLNVPCNATSESLAEAFSARAGEVTAVHLGGSTSASAAAAQSAHVVFKQAASMKKALGGGKELDIAVAEDAASAASAAHPNSGPPPSRAALQEAVGAFMERFEAEEAQRLAEEEARHNAMDADGFVVVSRKRTGRGNATDAQGATVGVASAGAERHFAAEAAGDGEEGGEGGEGAKRKKKRAKELTDFYHFQQHEKKREGLLKLREQFEADRERIAKMRAERKFKPQGY